MIKFSTGNGAWMAVSVPHDIANISADEDTVRYTRCDNNPFMRTIPTGKYTLYGIASELTEAQCAEIVGDAWKDFEPTEPECVQTTSRAWLASLLAAHNIPPHYLILKVD